MRSKNEICTVESLRIKSIACIKKIDMVNISCCKASNATSLTIMFTFQIIMCVPVIF